MYEHGGKLIRNKKPEEERFSTLISHVNFTRSRLTLVLLPRGADDELGERKC